ncbi:MAG: penicillin-binding protein activator, partial [Pikeienuella sp.]
AQPGAGAATGAQHTVSPRRPVTVALLIPGTAEAEGPARLGRAINNAAALAIGELRDPVLSVRVYNTAGDPAVAGDVARAALSDGADIFIGPLFAANTAEVATAVAAAGRKVISFSTITDVAGGPVTIIGYTPEAEVRRILRYAGEQGLRNIGIFYPLNDYGEAALKGARAVAAEGAVQIVATGGYERSFRGIETASAPFAQQARSVGVDAVLLPAGGRELQAVGSFLNFHGLDPAQVKYLGLGQWNSRATFGEAALRGGWFPAPDPGAFARFAGRYRAQYGEEPPLLSDLGYTGVQIVGQMLATARAQGSEAAFTEAELTRPQGFEGALGRVRLLPDGTAEHPLAILEVGEGRFIDRAPAARPPATGS